MAWRLNRALTNFRAAVNARWPDRDKTSDGTIGDVAHQATSSDHNPDPDGSVDAWDMDVDGVDVQACIRAALQHESIQYVIYNRRITSRSWGLGTWRTYTGSNPHDKHVHFNTRSSHENSTKPWNIEGDDMSVADVTAGLNTAMPYRSTGVRTWAKEGGWADVSQRLLAEYTWVSAAKTEQMMAAVLAAHEGLDHEAILARIDQHAAASAARDAADAQRDADLLALVQRVDTGEATAAEVVEQVRAMLHAATAPQA